MFVKLSGRDAIIVNALINRARGLNDMAEMGVGAETLVREHERFDRQAVNVVQGLEDIGRLKSVMRLIDAAKQKGVRLKGASGS